MTTPTTPPIDSPDQPAGSIKSLVQELRAESATLLQKEAELARTEVSEKISALGTHVTRISIGGAIAYAGLIVALFGLGDLASSLLVNGGVDPTMALWIGRLSVGVLVALIGWIMFAQARKAVKSDTLVPEQTLRTLRENKQWVQNKLQHSHEPV